MENSFKMLENRDFLDLVDNQTYESYSCESYGCSEEGICRCAQIDYVQIIRVDIQSLSQEFFKRIFSDSKSSLRDNKINEILYGFKLDLVNLYCIDRILTINRIYDGSNWEPVISSGYYGEELSDLVIKSSLFSDLNEQFNEVFNLDRLEDKIFYLLNLEYGGLLNTVKDKKFEILEVNIKDLIYGQKSHLKKVQSKNLDYYKDYSLPRGLVVETNGRYRVIDGYHRLSALNSEQVTLIVAK